jgi:hypothetical protein
MHQRRQQQEWWTQTQPKQARATESRDPHAWEQLQPQPWQLGHHRAFAITVEKDMNWNLPVNLTRDRSTETKDLMSQEMTQKTNGELSLVVGRNGNVNNWRGESVFCS